MSATSTPTFTVTHITDRVTKSGLTEVLLMSDAVDRSITLKALLDLSLFDPKRPLAKWHRLTPESVSFEKVEVDYEDPKTGLRIELKQPRQLVWLNGTIRRQGPAQMRPTVIVDEFDDEPTNTVVDDEASF